MTTKITLEAELRADVRFEISDDAPADLFTRAETEEFQSSLYGDSVADREGVLKHWAYNAIVNSVDDASRLDGWGDLDKNVVTMLVTNADIEEVYEA